MDYIELSTAIVALWLLLTYLSRPKGKPRYRIVRRLGFWSNEYSRIAQVKVLWFYVDVKILETYHMFSDELKHREVKVQPGFNYHKNVIK